MEALVTEHSTVEDNFQYKMETLVTEHSTVEDDFQCKIEALVTEHSTVEDNFQQTTFSALKVGGNFRCAMCDKYFSSKRALQRHLKILHGPKSHYSCKSCLKVFKCEEYLKNHIYHNKSECGLSDNSLSENINLSCLICFKGFPNEQDLDEHVEIEHGENLDAISSTESEQSTIEDNLHCSKCNKKYSSKRALQRHLKILHGPKSHYACKKCLKVFKCAEYLKYHIYTYAGQCLPPENKSECGLSDNSLSGNRNLSCLICFKGFPSEQDLDEHVETEHGENVDAISSTESNSIEYRKTQFICKEEGCNDEYFPSMKSFRLHLINIHKMKMTFSKHRFSSYKEFNEWRDDLCEKLGVEYATKSVNQNGNSKNITYYCKRSGTYNPRGTGVKRLKVQDSCKVGHFCTSSIKLCITEGYYHVEYCEDHYGHALGSTNLAHTTLPESTKIIVAEMLRNNVPRKNIPKMIRENDSMGERSKLITYQDVLNIENRSKLKLLQGLQPNKKLLYGKEFDDQQPSDEIEDILKEIMELNKSDKISNNVRLIVKKQLAQTLSMMNAVTNGSHYPLGGKTVILSNTQ